MNTDQWISELSTAYQSADLPFPPNKRTSLLAALSEMRSEAQKEIIAEALDIVTRHFFNKASIGEAFGPVSRIKERFGRSLEENYGLSSGPFIGMAKTYWTYKLEVGDLFPQYHNIVLSQMLLDLETTIAGLFFPTPGPATIPVAQRREAQRRTLQQYTPGIDIERFLNESPILRAGSKRGCLTAVIALVVLAALAAAYRIWV